MLTPTICLTITSADYVIYKSFGVEEVDSLCMYKVGKPLHSLGKCPLF